ncbi:MAG: hypothetical protein CK425_08385 [Parachlamydia sp.]|nr:MAG: hypothetical protein CK425_08385 [Parachlamydia sp.]
MTFFTFAVWMVLFSGAYAEDQIFTARVEVASPRLYLDQPLDIQLHLIYPAGYHTDPNTLIAHLLRNSSFNPFAFSLRRLPTASKTTTDGLIKETLTFPLQPEIPGTHNLSFFTVPLLPDDPSKNSVKSLTTDLFAIEVISPLSSLTEITPMPPLDLSPQLPVALSSKNRRKIKAILDSSDALTVAQARLSERTFPWEKIGTAFLGILLGLIVWMILKESKTEPLRRLKLASNSIQALQTLKHSQLLESKHFALFIEQLDGILKQHLQEQKGMQARALTTAELLPYLTSSEIKQFFLKTDQIKFAGYTPTLEECQEAENFVRHYLQRNG